MHFCNLTLHTRTEGSYVIHLLFFPLPLSPADVHHSDKQHASIPISQTRSLVPSPTALVLQQHGHHVQRKHSPAIEYHILHTDQPRGSDETASRATQKTHHSPPPRRQPPGSPPVSNQACMWVFAFRPLTRLACVGTIDTPAPDACRSQRQRHRRDRLPRLAL